MQLIRNALDPHHIQRTHLIEMLWLSVATFATLIGVDSMSYRYRCYLIILNLKMRVKHKVLALNLTY